MKLRLAIGYDGGVNSTPLLIDPNALALEDIIASHTQIVLSIKTTEALSFSQYLSSFTVFGFLRNLGEALAS